MTNALFLVALAAKVVWMDVDPAVLRGGNEPDDGLALLQAFHSSELTIRGVSVVFGNSALDVGYRNGSEIVARFGPDDLRVYTGAASNAELGQENDATQALQAALREEPLTILALGPVTNVATVLKNHPELSARVEEIIVVAGRRPGFHTVFLRSPRTRHLGAGGRCAECVHRHRRL